MTWPRDARWTSTALRCSSNGRSGHPLPVWVAAYGPQALRCAGRVADGLIMQLADPFIIEWALRYLREGAEEADRDPAGIKVMAAAPAYLSDDLAHAREQVRWFPALVSNHVVDLVKRYHDDAELPTGLTDYIAARERYDYAHHGRAGSDNAGVRHRRGGGPVLRAGYPGAGAGQARPAA